MVDGTVPLSWFENNSLEQVVSNEQLLTKSSTVFLVQVHEIDERSDGRWNGSRELIVVQVSGIEH